MSFFHHDEQPRVVINSQPPTEAKPSGNDAGNVGESDTKATYDAVTAGLAQHGTAADNGSTPAVDGSVQALTTEGNATGVGAQAETAVPSADPSTSEAPQPFDPSPRVDTSDPHAMPEPIGPEKPMISPQTEYDAFGVPIVKTNSEPDTSNQGNDTLVSEGPAEASTASSQQTSHEQDDTLVSEKPAPQPEDTPAFEFPKPPETLSELSVGAPVETQKWVESIDAELESLHADIVEYQKKLDEFTAKVEDLKKTKAAFTNPEVARAVQYMEKNKTEEKDEDPSSEETGHSSAQEDAAPHV